MRTMYYTTGEWEFEIVGMAQGRLVRPSDGITPDEYELEWLFEPEIVKAFKRDEEVSVFAIPKGLYKEVMNEALNSNDLII
jgi:hypothetical protein